MVEVDARGLSCPEPLMMAMEAVKKNPKEKIKILVSEPHQKMNVEKYVKSQGKKISVRQLGSEFELIVE
ncbi:sulfurtransferase TusA family protein [Diplocloster agilis]|uniref:sulfurtransferase TusA family protein n=1 Tax=Diplocloster agilis TaxID=2850323 RepID=UPI000822950F|nr:sulfurtransferase TusA family protein [Suonthocola fibrivorans]MCU6734001.1 sulfurtransferase TusA family protein [Suonthocola fibrivorans]SCJ18943.1 sulfur transfer protein SirA [uncultured Clostridium sp.]